MSEWLQDNSWIWLVVIILAAAVVGGIAFLIHKVLNKNNPEVKPTEEEIAKENLDSILETVDDEETKKQFENFENESKEDK